MGYSIIPNKSKERHAFYCRALTGMSNYNISINSDMTISCSCNDKGKEGILGNLREATFNEIYNGVNATEYRKQLSEGRLPTSLCGNCADLSRAPKSIAAYYAEHYQIPKGIMVENCSICNYNCKYCSRGQIKRHRKTDIITIEEMERVAKEIKENNIQEIHLFKLGEPFYDKDILPKMKIL
jgi:MoaA/NifB/PqqE/SkfB family radical SAM enzyme